MDGKEKAPIREPDNEGLCRILFEQVHLLADWNRTCTDKYPDMRRANAETILEIVRYLQAKN